MKNNKFNRVLSFMLIIFMLFSTSSSVSAANVYTFKPGNNTISVDEYVNGAFFKVEKTGVYRFNMLPNVEDFEWQYLLSYGEDSGEYYRLNLAAKKEDNVYKLYSADVPYVLLIENKQYKITKGGNNNKLLDSGSETYITINLSVPEVNEDGRYYEASEKEADWELDEGKFQLFYQTDSSNDNYQKECSQLITNIDGIVGKEDKTDFIQQLITGILVGGLGNGAMFLIGVVAGEPITIDKILFNRYSRIRLAFFEKEYIDPDTKAEDPNKTNPLLVDGGIVGPDGILNKYYERFTMIAVVAYIAMLLYMSIRIVLSSTGKDMAKYKKLFADWVIGVMILFLFPYVMRYTIKINDAIVAYIGDLRQQVTGIEEPEVTDYPGGLAFPFGYVGSEGVAAQDYMAKMKEQALETGKVIYALCWLLMIWELVSFLIIYLKRLLITTFLIVIFPLVTISYAIDKIADGKSQAFNTWMKEFILNVFLQTFHAINYVVVMGLIFAIKADNFIFILIGLTYLSNGDKIMRGIFAHMKGGGAGTVKSVGESLMAMSAVKNVVKSSVNTAKNSMKGLKRLSDRKLEISNKTSKIKEKNTQDKWDSWNLEQGRNLNGFADIDSPNANAEADTSRAMSDALDSRSSDAKVQNSVGYLRQASIAGGETQAAYERQMRELQQANPEKYNELMELMDYSDAVDAMQNLEQLNEAEINAHLDVIIRDRKKKGNFKKLNSILEKQGFDEKAQDKLKAVLDKRKLTSAKEAELNRTRKSIYTKEDAQAVDKMRALNDKASEITDKQAKLESQKLAISAKRAELERNIARLENDYKVTSKERRKEKKKIMESQIADCRKQISELDKYEEATNRSLESLQNNGLSFEDRKKLFELSEEKSRVEKERVNKNIDVNTERVAHDKVAEQEKYMEIARAASNGVLSPQQQAVAEAQAIIDGSDSGQYSIQELWNANQTLKKAASSTDEGVKKILEASANSTNAKPEGFDQMLASLVINNEKKLQGTHDDIQRMVAEAKKQMLEKADEGGIYQHIADEAHLEIKTDSAGNKTVKTVKEDSLQRAIKDVENTREVKQEQYEKLMGAEIIDDESYRNMKSERFVEALHMGADVATIAADSLGTVATIGAGFMLKGASPDTPTADLVIPAHMAGSAVNKVTNTVIEKTTNTIGSVTNKFSGLADSARKGQLDAKKIASTMVYGDSNKQGVETRNKRLENAYSEIGAFDSQMKAKLHEIEVKNKQYERIKNNREALARRLNNNDNS